MRIKLILPRKARDPGAMGLTVPLVLPHLAAITPRGHQVELVDLFKERFDLSDRPDLVGISVMTPMAEAAYQIADLSREKGIKVVLGGHHPSAMPMEAKGHADAVVLGEAEDTWPALLKDLEAGQLKEFYITGPRPSSLQFLPHQVHWMPERPSLDHLPLPKREWLRGRYFFDSIMTTRGCPYHCQFCGTSDFYGETLRHRPPEQVAEEVRSARRFWFMADDDIFGDIAYRLALYERLTELHRWMRWHGAGCLAVAYDKAGEEVLHLAAQSGLNAVMVGLESAEPKTLAQLQIAPKLRQEEEIDFRRVAAGIKKIQEFNIMVVGFFVLGSETDTRETFDKTLHFCDETGVVPIPFLLMPLPGTPMWEDYQGRLLPGLNWGKWDAVHALFSHPTLGIREREELLYRLRRASYSFRRVMRRLKGLSLDTVLFSFLLQVGLRLSFRADWRRVVQG
ncbi:MAG: radical SAM protein [candidate division NC10 bacterium]|nr:radical SAM protein [candidate division NC10 bacterium]